MHGDFCEYTPSSNPTNKRKSIRIFRTVLYIIYRVLYMPDIKQKYNLEEKRHNKAESILLEI